MRIKKKFVTLGLSGSLTYMLKHCCECEKMKDQTQFHQDKTRSSGLACACKTCRSARYRRNREANIRRSQTWRKSNQDWFRAYQAKRRAENPVYTRAAGWRSSLSGRLRKLGFEVPFPSVQEVTEILVSLGGTCVQCGAKGTLQVDHVKPIRIAPELAFLRSNLQKLCVSCHRKKTASEMK